MKYYLLAVLSALSPLLPGSPAAAQAPAPPARRAFVFFRDKAGSAYSLSQPLAFLSARALARRQRQGIALLARDLPVSAAYLAQVRAVPGAPRVLYTSRWLNGAVLAADSATLARVAGLPAVARTQLLSLAGPQPPGPPPAVGPAPAPPPPASVRARYGRAFAQNQLIGAVAMQQAGYRGEGLQIAVFDAGFPGVDRMTAFQRVREQGRVASTRNFVDGGAAVYLRNGHGTACLSTIGAELPGYFVGTAPRATFHLCLTEDVGSEYPIEEANWLAAAEYADSAGVDVISSSLGYTTFDRGVVSHTYADLDGRTALSSRAALGAARVGMVVVVSAGNDGNNAWRRIGVPADADSILTVAAVDSLGNHAGFSSYGPTADGRGKPTLAAMGVAAAVLTPSGAVVRGNGTSYACPALAGLVAGFWQANPGLTAQQVIAALTQSAPQAAAPDNALGFGIADFGAAIAATASPTLTVYPNPSHLDELLLALPPGLRGRALHVRVRDARGRLLGEQQVAATPTPAATLRLPARGLAPGAYLVTVQPQAGGPAQTARFVRE